MPNCSGESDGAHRWQWDEPPEWLDWRDWDDEAWSGWYDQANATCSSCGERYED